MAMASPRPPPSKPVDLDLTIVSAKHLKNVNWKNGHLKPYVVFWIDPDRRLATKSDDSGSTSPVWNERITLPLTQPSSIHDSFLTLEVFHSRPSDTPKPLVGTLRLSLKDLDDLEDSTRIRKFTLTRPSGRPQGKIHLKLGLLGRPPPPSPPSDYTSPPSIACYFPSNPIPPPPPPHARGYSRYTPSPSPPPFAYTSYPDTYPGYYSGYYSGAPPPPPPPRPFFDRSVNYVGPSGPSAPLDYSPYDQKQKGVGSGLAVGAVAGALGGLALEQGLKYEEQKIAERVENEIAARDDYSNYRDY